MNPEAALFAREFDRAGRRVGVCRRGGLVGSDIFVVAERYRVSAHELVDNIERRAAIAALKCRRSRGRRGHRDLWPVVLKDLVASTGVTGGAVAVVDDVPLAAQALGTSVIDLLDVVEARIAQGFTPQPRVVVAAQT